MKIIFYCIIVDAMLISFAAWLGWLVFNGVTSWMIAPMLFSLAICITVNKSHTIRTCPKCGYSGDYKEFIPEEMK